MIKLKATALIRSISPVIEIPSKTGGQPYQKRELVLDDSWTKDGKTYESLVLIEFSGDKMSQLDAYVPGQRVNVEAYVTGREHNGRVFNTLKGSSLAPYQAQQPAASAGQYAGAYPQQPQYPPAPGYPQQTAYPPGGYPQQPAYPQQGGYPNQGSYARPTAAPPMPGTPQSGNLGPEGLPFR